MRDERFGRLYREDVIDAYLFSDIEQVEIISDKWSEDYNEKHPHGSLGGLSPRHYARLNQKGFYDNQIMEELSKSSLFEKG